MPALTHETIPLTTGLELKSGVVSIFFNDTLNTGSEMGWENKNWGVGSATFFFFPHEDHIVSPKHTPHLFYNTGDRMEIFYLRSMIKLSNAELCKNVSFQGREKIVLPHQRRKPQKATQLFY